MIGIYAPTVVNGIPVMQTQVFYGTGPAKANLTIVGLPRIRTITGEARIRTLKGKP